MKNKLLFITSIIVFLAFAPSSFAKSNQLKSDAKPTIQVKSQKVNLNTAGAKEIAKSLTGVGLKKAHAIVEYRKKHGDFKKVEDVAAVKGIGVLTLTKNQGRILLK